MEKLINILPNLITNENTDWIKDVLNPDRLTIAIMMHFNKEIPIMASTSFDLINKHQSELDDLNGIRDDSSIKDLVTALSNSTHLKDGKKLADKIEELDKKYNLEGKSITAVLWIADILNRLENYDISQRTLYLSFVYLARTADKNKNVSILHDEVRDILIADKNIAPYIDDYLKLAFVKNKLVQTPTSWYEFETLKEIPMNNTPLSDDKQMLAALGDISNYNSIIDYIKTKYLSETKDVTSDSYCADENERNYKAFIIIATLAYELHKNDPDFDKDNNIGLNIATEILIFQESYNNKNILNPLTNGLNHFEEAAGRICETILGRKLSLTKPKTVAPKQKATFRYGDMQKYIMAKLDTFKLFIEPTIKYYEELALTLNRFEKYYSTRNCRGRQSVLKTLKLISNEVGVDLVSAGGQDKTLRANLANLSKAVRDRLVLLLGIQRVFDKVKKQNKSNLNVTDFTKGLGAELALADPQTLEIIHQFYLAVADDPILKGDPNQVLRIKSPKYLAQDIKAQVEQDKDKVPEIARLTGKFSLEPKEMAIKLAQDKYAPVDQTDVNPEYEELYRTVRLPKNKASVEEKKAVVDKANLTQQEKDEFNNLLQ